MAVSAIEKNRNSGNIGYGTSMLFGAMAGFSLQWALPVTPQERDENYKAKLNEIKSKSKEIKLEAIELIKNSKNKAIEEDIFISMYDKNKLRASNISEIKKLKNPKTGQNKVLDIIKNINNEAREINILERKDLKAAIKHRRPTAIFLATGAGFGFIIAVLHNIINRIATDRATKIVEG